ncbi:hypothetical protein BC332_18505 [Capsicum chinense]|nr:hypothetical protein BC332_18505 [Capsicum chinense]
MESHDSKLDDLGKKLDVLMEKLIAPQDGILGSAPRPGPPLDTSGSRPRMEEQGDNGWGRNLGNHHHPRMEFPFFKVLTLAHGCVKEKVEVLLDGKLLLKKFAKDLKHEKEMSQLSRGSYSGGSSGGYGAAREDPKELEGEAHPETGNEDLTLVLEDEGIQEVIGLNALCRTEVPNTIRL